MSADSGLTVWATDQVVTAMSAFIKKSDLIVFIEKVFDLVD